MTETPKFPNSRPIVDESVERLAEKAAKKRPDLNIETDPEKRAIFSRRLHQNYLEYLNATAPELLGSYDANRISENGNFFDGRTGKETDKTPSALIQDPYIFGLIKRAADADYVRRFEQNCVRFLKATSPKLLKLYKPWVSETGRFVNAETSEEEERTPRSLITDQGALDMIRRSTNLEVGLPEYFGRKDEKVAKKQGLE